LGNTFAASTTVCVLATDRKCLVVCACMSSASPLTFLSSPACLLLANNLLSQSLSLPQVENWKHFWWTSPPHRHEKVMKPMLLYVPHTVPT